MKEWSCEQKDKEIADLKRKNQELLAKLYEQIVDEHRPAFCKLAGRDCPALNESEIRADERRKVCEEIREKALRSKRLCFETSSAEFQYSIFEFQLDKIEGETE